MKTNFIFIFSFFLLGSLLLTSCKSKQIPGETKETIIHKVEKVKDTILVVEKDSSFYAAYIDCVNGKPVLVQSEKQIKDYNSKNPGSSAKPPKGTPGKNLKTPNISIENGQLKVDCQKEAEKLLFTWKETFIKEWEITHKPVLVEKELTRFQKIKIAIGTVVIWISGLAVLAFLIRYLISLIISKK